MSKSSMFKASLLLAAFSLVLAACGDDLGDVETIKLAVNPGTVRRSTLRWPRLFWRERATPWRESRSTRTPSGLRSPPATCMPPWRSGPPGMPTTLLPTSMEAAEL